MKTAETIFSTFPSQIDKKPPSYQRPREVVLLLQKSPNDLDRQRVRNTLTSLSGIIMARFSCKSGRLLIIKFDQRMSTLASIVQVLNDGLNENILLAGC